LERNPNITCEFTKADWEWWYANEDKKKKLAEERAKKKKLTQKKYQCPKCTLITTKGALANHIKAIHPSLHNFVKNNADLFKNKSVPETWGVKYLAKLKKAKQKRQRTKKRKRKYMTL